jgi:hypothetical protein
MTHIGLNGYGSEEGGWNPTEKSVAESSDQTLEPVVIKLGILPPPPKWPSKKLRNVIHKVWHINRLRWHE